MGTLIQCSRMTWIWDPCIDFSLMFCLPLAGLFPCHRKGGWRAAIGGRNRVRASWACFRMIQFFQARRPLLWLICPLSCDPFTTEDIMQTVGQQKDGKASGIDSSLMMKALWYGGPKLANFLWVVCAMKPWLMERLLNTGLIVPIPKGWRGGFGEGVCVCQAKLNNHGSIHLLLLPLTICNGMLWNRTDPATLFTAIAAICLEGTRLDS